MHEKAIHPASLLTAKGMVCLVLTCAFFSIPGIAAALSVIDPDDLVLDKGGSRNLTVAVDVAVTPGGPGEPVAIPYPVLTTSEKDSSTGKIKFTSEIVIRSSKISRSSGEDSGISLGSLGSVGIRGEVIQFSWDTNVVSDESALLSILLANPSTKRPFGPGYQVDVTDTQTGSVSFDISNLPTVEFDIIFRAIQTTPRDLPLSRLALTDFAVDGVSFADRFSVSEVPLPPALLLFATGMLGLALIRKRQIR